MFSERLRAGLMSAAPTGLGCSRCMPLRSNKWAVRTQSLRRPGFAVIFAIKLLHKAQLGGSAIFESAIFESHTAPDAASRVSTELFRLPHFLRQRASRGVRTTVSARTFRGQECPQHTQTGWAAASCFFS